MATNYWDSTQRQYWFFTREVLADIRDEVEASNSKAIEQHPLPDRRHMLIFIKDRLLQLAKRLQFRQQCVATALVYIHRYLLSTALQNTNLYLLVATAFYLASKTEESPHHIRLVASEARQAWPEYMTGDMARIGEMEFSLISEMRSQLIVWHPYRTLAELKDDTDLKLTPDELGFAWSVINDSYMTDLPLTCPPHSIAVIAVMLAILFQPSQPKLGERSLGYLSSNPVETSAFSSLTLGGRPGLAGGMRDGLSSAAMLDALGHQTSSQPTSHPSSQLSNSSVGSQMSTSSWPINGTMSSEKVQRFISFLADSDMDIEGMIDATQEIISLYESWEQYNEKATREAVARCLKGRGLDS